MTIYYKTGSRCITPLPKMSIDPKFVEVTKSQLTLME